VISVLQGERWKRSFTSSPLNNSHWKVKYLVKQKSVLLLCVFQFSVARHVSECIRICKMDTDVDKMVHSMNVLCIHCIK
jgi:Uri superfamily endonuclease